MQEIETPFLKKNRIPKKGLKWMLDYEVEMELEPQEIAKKFWTQKIIRISNIFFLEV